jgi:hypothetical protein
MILMRRFALAALFCALTAAPGLAQGMRGQDPGNRPGDPPTAPPQPGVPPPPTRSGLVGADGFDPATMAGLLRQWGYRGELRYDKDGEPEILSGIEGINYLIFMYDCTKGRPQRCKSYQFWASFSELNPPLTVSRVNEWNERRRLSTASLGDQGRVRLKFSVNPVGADLGLNLRAYLAWWGQAVREFKTFINFRS